MRKKTVVITGLLFAVPLAVLWGIVPMVQGARRQDALRSSDPAVVARAIKEMMASGTSYEDGALRDYDRTHPLCALDVEHGVGVLAVADEIGTVYELSVAPSPMMVRVGDGDLVEASAEIYAAMMAARKGRSVSWLASTSCGSPVEGAHRVSEGSTVSFVVKLRDETRAPRLFVSGFDGDLRTENYVTHATHEQLAAWRQYADWPTGW